MSIFLLFCSCDALLGVLPFLLGSIERTRGGFYFHFITSKLIQPREGSAWKIAKHRYILCELYFSSLQKGLCHKDSDWVAFRMDACWRAFSCRAWSSYNLFRGKGKELTIKKRTHG